MAGITKRKYMSENIRIYKQMTNQLNSIKKILPEIYDGNILFDLYSKYFSTTIQMLNQRYEYYRSKDIFLRSVGKKKRYKILNSKDFFFSSQKVKHMLSYGQRLQHKQQYSEECKTDSLIKLEQKLNKSLSKKLVITKKCEHIQDIEPIYIDIFIKIYHRSNHLEKILIFNELKKFNSNKTINFFYKLNDSEHNNQIRMMAFQHLQNLGKYVKVRKKFKGNKKSYHIDSTLPNYSPEELVKFLNSNSVESKKKYDIFISHSYLDKDLVKSTKNALNLKNLSCYYDWTSDQDFLKRTLISDYTKEVLKKRIEQSEIFLLLLTHNVIAEDKIISEWVEMEIEYAKSLGKKILCINLANVKHKFTDLNFELRGTSIYLTEIFSFFEKA
ncbi:toll/interleukin-1 receptor domain-containing protein [Acinetobacter sp. YH12120]|uniref:toll/interleukin-1 receptor domain-containing protein n=1 Tax=Acinetobacter sp. YH12120 TaxID=2601107 RepID=UPI0015D30F8E|nr:toll/interleukin-1 receptor domain-containing protein [Acinetobacter sp. YH12120]